MKINETRNKLMSEKNDIPTVYLIQDSDRNSPTDRQLRYRHETTKRLKQIKFKVRVYDKEWAG